MSRIAKEPIVIPANVNVEINDQVITISGNNGELTHVLNNAVKVNYDSGKLIFSPRNGYMNGWAHAGTARALLYSMIVGVTKGFTKRLQLVGIGYRATIDGNVVSLFLGFSHPINYQLPYGVTAECLSQTEIILKGANKQAVGQVAADLRSYRNPEPYKGKGIHYIDEVVRIKESKKK